MKSGNKSFMLQLRVSHDVAEKLQNIAGAANMDRNEYLRAWLGVIANVKRQYAIKAMGSIPEEYMKGTAGRPNDATLDA
jgi:hypothetical protein